MNALRLCLALLAPLVLQGCTKKPDDKAVTAQVVGIWAMKPRAQILPEKLDTFVHSTPEDEIFQFAAPDKDDRGAYAEYTHRPKQGESAERWEVRRGSWFVSNGSLTLQPSKADGSAPLKIVSVGPKALRLDGFPLIPCKDGCTFTPASELPEAARKAEPF